MDEAPTFVFPILHPQVSGLADLQAEKRGASSIFRTIAYSPFVRH